MAIRLDASGDYVSRASAVSIGSFTCMGWTQMVTDRGSATTQPILILTRTFGTNADIFFDWEDGGVGDGVMTIGSYDGSTAPTTNFGSRPAAGDWFHWYVKCSGSGSGNLEAGWRRLQDSAYVTATAILASGSVGSTPGMRLGDDGFGSWSNARFAAIKCYSTALAAGDIERERLTFEPRNTTNLSFWVPMINTVVADAVKDYSGAAANLTANGTLTLEGGPPIAYRQGRRTLILPAGATGISGTLATTESADTASFAGDVVVSSTLAVTESSDTASFAGQVVISAALAATENADTASFAGAIGTSGSLAVTETPDTAAFVGDVIVSGSLVVTEGQDTAAFSGSVIVSGSLVVTEGQDTAAFAGGVIVSGSLAVTEGADTAAFAGTIGDVVSGTLAATESADTASFAGSVVVSGSLSTTEGIDTAAFSGSVVVSGSLTTTENQDTAVFTGSVEISGSLAVTEGQDTAIFSGTVASSLTGTLAATEAPDALFFYEQTGGGIWRWKEGMEALHVKRNAPAMPPEFKKAAQVMSSAGGHARAASLTPKQRTVIARNAAQARWK